MSLFGTPLKRSQTLPLSGEGPAAQKPFSLFPSSSSAPTGATATTSATATTALFGNLGNTPAQSTFAAPTISTASNAAKGTTGLFGSLGASTTQPAAGSSSGTSGFFGSLGANNPQQPQTGGSLFSRLGSSTQPTVAAGSSPFGGSNSNTLIGGSGSTQPSNTLGGSLFATGKVPAQSVPTASLFASLASQPTGSVSQNTQAVPSQSAYFDQMLERGKKRNILENGGFGDLPSLQLGLADIARKARNLGTGGPTAAEARAGDPRA
jgi:nuclear pore complex protein Nup93